jgi:hypothetical protein
MTASFMDLFDLLSEMNLRPAAVATAFSHGFAQAMLWVTAGLALVTLLVIALPRRPRTEVVTTTAEPVREPAAV